MKVSFTRSARADLIAIGSWIERDDPARAKSFVAELVDSCNAITDLPHGCPTISTVRHPLRRRNFKRYRIIFRALPNKVRIIAVSHGSRDTHAIMAR